jgi:hypothetical protein
MKCLFVIAALSFCSTVCAAETTYDLSLTLGDPGQYSGQETVTLGLEGSAPSLLKLNFAGGRITAAKINSEPAQVKTTAGHVELAGAALKAGPNTVEIAFEHRYVYIKEVFEPNTLAAFENGIGNFADPFFRLKGWVALWGQVQAQKLPQNYYVGIVVKGLAQKSDQVIVQYVLGTLCQKGDEESCLRAKKALPPPPRSEHH